MKGQIISKSILLSLALFALCFIGAINSQDTYSLIDLPHETSIPIQELVVLGNSDVYLKRLVYIIGFLPDSEQQALLKAYTVNKGKDATILFDLATYNSVMVGTGDSSAKFRLTAKSVGGYVTKNTKWFRKGLGCLLKVANQYNPNQNYNTFKQVNQLIRDMTNAQIQVNNCRARFGMVLNQVLKSRRRFLLTTISNQSADGIYNNFTSQDYFIRFRYTYAEMNSLVQQYRSYANCELAFNSAVYSRVIESQQMIAQLPDCKGDSNPLAGTSSFPASSVPLNNFTADDQKKPIGINNGNGIRSDGKTQNNYALQGGFGLGSKSLTLNTSGTPLLRIPTKILNSVTQLLTNLNTFTTTTDSWYYLRTRIGATLNSSSVYRPTPYLHNRVLSNINNISSAYLNEFYKGERGDACVYNNNFNVNISTDYLVYCDTLSCNCIGANCPPGIAGTFNISWMTPMSSNIGTLSGYVSENSFFSWNFNYSNSYVATFCRNSSRYIYAEATDNLLGNLVDYIAKNQVNSTTTSTINQSFNLGATFSYIQQGCIGTFSDGQRNDKDACRDVINTKCGVDLDYGCEISGLYYYLPANPVAPKSVVYECDQSNPAYSDVICFAWINRHFIAGTLTFKPSGFLGLGLATQNSLKTTSTQFISSLRNLQESTFIPSDSTSVELMTDVDATRYSYLQSNTDSYNLPTYINDFVVDSSTAFTFPTAANYLSDVQSSVNSLNNGSDFIQLSFVSIMIILLAAILF